MLPIGVFNAHLAKVGNVLRSLRLLERAVSTPRYELVQAGTMAHLSYRQQFDTCLAGSHYDYLLNDRSFLQFRRWSENGGEWKLSYSYYECPRITSTYENFLYDTFQVRADEVEDNYQEEYETYLATQAVKETVTPMRYDLNVDDYTEGLHPISHLHVGHENDIRLALRKVLRPMSFLLLVIRQRYPRTWVRCLAQPGIAGLCRDIRDTLTNVPAAFWKLNDQHQLYLA
jgi:hypothetical protein